jgi:hypothetical protein
VVRQSSSLVYRDTKAATAAALPHSARSGESGAVETRDSGSGGLQIVNNTPLPESRVSTAPDSPDRAEWGRAAAVAATRPVRTGESGAVETRDSGSGGLQIVNNMGTDVYLWTTASERYPGTRWWRS